MVLHPADAGSERLSELAPGRTHDTPAFQHRWWAIEHRRLSQRRSGTKTSAATRVGHPRRTAIRSRIAPAGSHDPLHQDLSSVELISK